MRKKTQRFSSLWLLFGLATTTTVPVIDTGSVSSAPAVEGEHDPGSCPPGHDHAICQLVKSNPAGTLPAAMFRLAVVLGKTSLRAGSEPAAHRHHTSARSRAPPSI